MTGIRYHIKRFLREKGVHKTLKIISVQNLDFSKGNGLIPVVAQDSESKSVLMLAYVNQEALKKTFESG